MKGRMPTPDEAEYMQRVRDLGCIVCRLHHDCYSPAAIHHMDGKTKPGAHYHILPLCFVHHQGGNDCDEYTSRHPHKTKFEARYGKELDLYHTVNTILSCEQ